MRSPKTPLTPTTTTSPSCTTLTNAASIPADPVPLLGSASALAVRNTARSRSHVSSSTERNSGSRCPSRGRVIASTAAGDGLHGPGPLSTRAQAEVRAREARDGGDEGDRDEARHPGGGVVDRRADTDVVLVDGGEDGRSERRNGQGEPEAEHRDAREHGADIGGAGTNAAEEGEPGPRDDRSERHRQARSDALRE